MADKICCLIYSVVDNKKLFLILHKNNWWNGWELVRGDVIKNESIADAAYREANEKTGLNLSKVISFPFNYSYEYMKNIDVINTHVSCFIAKATDINVSLSNEHNYYKWTDYETAMKLLDFEEQKAFLRNANSFI
jgi:8-oxo-dGTP pyrophosphatase MutT (NUDIX family)